MLRPRLDARRGVRRYRSDHYDKFPVSVWPLVRASMTRRYQSGRRAGFVFRSLLHNTRTHTRSRATAFRGWTTSRPTHRLGIPVVPLEKGLFDLAWPFQLMTRLGVLTPVWLPLDARRGLIQVPAAVQRDVLFPVTLPLAFFTSLANSVYAVAFEPSAKSAAAAPSWAGNHSTSAYKHALFAGVGVADVSRAGL